MGTIADKLALLQATKTNLKAALSEKGQTVGDVFSEYPAAVRAIETGGYSVTPIEVTFSVDTIPVMIAYFNAVTGSGYVEQYSCQLVSGSTPETYTCLGNGLLVVITVAAYKDKILDNIVVSDSPPPYLSYEIESDTVYVGIYRIMSR